MTLRGVADIMPFLTLERSGGLAIATLVGNRSRATLSLSTRLVISESGETSGRIHPALDAVLVEDGLASLREKRSRLRSYQLDGEVAERAGTDRGNVDVYYDVLAKSPRLVIVGAGHIAVPLARIAKLLDFETIVVDDRGEYASRQRFPEADHILVGPYQETTAKVPIDSDTYIVLVTRGHVHDQACLEAVIHSPASYIGMIGSRRRVETVKRHMVDAGHAGEQLANLHAPIGLDIAARTPAEIALAVMAEIVNVRRRGRAPSLAGVRRSRV